MLFFFRFHELELAKIYTEYMFDARIKNPYITRDLMSDTCFLSLKQELKAVESCLTKA